MIAFLLRATLLATLVASGFVRAAVPLSDFARHEQFRDVRISPGGDYVAANAVVDGKAVLSLIHLSDMKGVNLRPREGGEVVQFWWVAPHRVLYTVSERTGVLEQPGSTGELYAVNADGSGKRLLIGYRANREWVTASVVRPLYVADNKVLIEKDHWNGSHEGGFPVAAMMDVDSGAVVDRATAPIRNATFVADNHGRVRFAYAEGTDQKHRVYYRATEGDDWALVFDESKKDPVLTPLGFDRDESHVYFSCGGARGVGGLCLWDVGQRKLDTLWSGRESGIVELVRSFDRKEVVAIRSMPGRTETTLIGHDAPETKLLSGLMQQFPGEDVHITSSTPDGSKVVFLVASGNDPGQFFLYDSATHKAAFLFARRPWIKPDQMAVVEPVSLKARDGLPLHGYLTKPTGHESAKNLPTVVFVHGGPYGIRDDWDFDPYVQLLASRGYAVLQVNYRGSGGYGDAFVHAGYREWGGRMQDDVTDATHWAVAQGIADPKRLCIFGGSYGGYAALEGAVKEPDLYACAIGYVGVYDLRLMYTRGDIPQSSAGDNYLRMVLGDDQALLWDRSPVAHVDQLKAKVMLIVGGQDTRVPPVQGETLRSALNKAHIDHEWLYQRTEGHGFYDEKNAEDLFAKVIAFLDHNIGAGRGGDR
jgi:dipeptidyl aminopeptidase/acylaminoacyl peptidase